MRARSAVAAALMCAGLALNPAMAQAQEKATIAVAVKALSFAPIFLAADMGALSKRGITPDIVVTSGGIQPMAALIAGDADFAASANDVTLAMANTQRFIAIYTFNNSFTQELIGRKETIAARKATPDLPWRERVRRLKGITVGALSLGGSSDLAGRWLWRESGLDHVNDMTVIRIGALPALITAMKQGSIDAFVLSSPAREIAERQKIGTAVVRFDEVEDWLEEPHENLSVLRTFLATKRDLAQRVVDAIAEAQKFTHDDPRAAAEILSKGSFSEVDRDLIEGALRNMRIAWRQQLMSSARWATTIKSRAAVNPKAGSLTLREGVDWTNDLYPKDAPR